MWCELSGVTVELLLTFRSTSTLKLLIAHFGVETSLGSLDAGFKHLSPIAICKQYLQPCEHPVVLPLQHKTHSTLARQK